MHGTVFYTEKEEHVKECYMVLHMSYLPQRHWLRAHSFGVWSPENQVQSTEETVQCLKYRIRLEQVDKHAQNK